MSIQELTAWNEKMASRYDIDDYYARSSWVIRWIEERRIASIVRLLKASDGLSTLEVGCGAGHLLERIGRTRMLGIDLSRAMLAKARQRLDRPVMLASADAHQLPVRDKSFDRILCSEVLEHLEDPATALAELLRVAKGGARIVVTVPNERVINRLKSMMNAAMLTRIVLGEYHSARRMDEEWHLHSFSLADIKAIVPRGLRLTAVESIPSSLIPVRYVLLLEPA